MTPPEIEEFLANVWENATLPWVFPMTAFIAYPGARRSASLRAAVTDIDLAAGVITIREKKRIKGKRSTRTAPLTPKLADILRIWLADLLSSSMVAQSWQYGTAPRKPGNV